MSKQKKTMKAEILAAQRVALEYEKRERHQLRELRGLIDGIECDEGRTRAYEIVDSMLEERKPVAGALKSAFEALL